MSHPPTEPSKGRTETVERMESDRHRLLAAERRRAVLDVLSNRPTPVALEDLVAAIVAREDDPTVPDGELEKRVAISLHHNHLPLMTDLGVIDYDPATTEVVAARLTVDRRSSLRT